MQASTFVQILSLLFTLIFSARCQVFLTTPGPNETYYADSDCTIAWEIDTSGVWTNVTIDLMSGSNNNMSSVTNVVSGLDGTDPFLTPYNWTCPEVDPYSAIYFYQITNGGNTSTASWSTRFTIASTSGETVPPPYSVQPNGEPIPWGIGTLQATPSSDFSSESEDATAAFEDTAIFLVTSALSSPTTEAEQSQETIPNNDAHKHEMNVATDESTSGGLVETVRIPVTLLSAARASAVQEEGQSLKTISKALTDASSENLCQHCEVPLEAKNTSLRQTTPNMMLILVSNSLTLALIVSSFV